MRRIFLFLILASMLLTGCGHGIDSGTGKKIGQVIQLGQHGMFCKTYEGQLMRGGFNTGSGVNGGAFDFTIEDPELYQQLQRAMEKQQEIEITYRKVSFSGYCTAESDHFVLGYRVLTDTAPSVIVKPPVDERAARRQELERQLRELDSAK